MQIRAWSLGGLPADNFSVENAIIVANSSRYSLLIDPQGKLMCRCIGIAIIIIITSNS